MVMRTIKSRALVRRWNPTIVIGKRIDVVRHRVNDSGTATLVEQRFHNLTEHQSLISLNRFGMNGFYLLCRRIAQEFPSVANAKVPILVAVGKLVVTDVRVGFARDAKLGRFLK